MGEALTDPPLPADTGGRGGPGCSVPLEHRVEPLLEAPLAQAFLA